MRKFLFIIFIGTLFSSCNIHSEVENECWECRISAIKKYIIHIPNNEPEIISKEINMCDILNDNNILYTDTDVEKYALQLSIKWYDYFNGYRNIIITCYYNSKSFTKEVIEKQEIYYGR